MAEPEEVDFELISAFIDGRLSGADRERAVRLLADSEAAFEVYSDALRARADLVGSQVVPIPIGRKWPLLSQRAWIPAAAAAVLLVAFLPTIVARSNRAVLDAPARLIAQPVLALGDLPGSLGPGWEERDWSVMRGGGASAVDSSVEFRLGVRATDLQVALAAGDRDTSRRLATEIVGLLQPISLADLVRADYDNVRAQLANGEALPRVSATASGAEERLEKLSSRWFDFGRWFSAGEIAGRTRAGAFFEARATTRFLDSAIEDGALPPSSVEALRHIAVLAGQGPSGEDFDVLRQKFAELIRRHGG